MGETGGFDGGVGRVAGRRLWIVGACVAALLAVILAARFRSLPPVRYSMRFPTTPAGEPIIPYSINDHGQVVGWAFASGDERHIYVWDPDGAVRDLGSFDSPEHAECLCINNVGLITGSRLEPNGLWRAFVRELDGRERLLDTLGGPWTKALALNNGGVVVGVSETPVGNEHAVLWDATGVITDLGTLGGSESLACSVNDIEQVTGFSQIRGGAWHAFFWDRTSGITDLGVTSLKRPSSEIHVNNQGFVVGRFGSASDEALLSSWSRATGARRLGALDVTLSFLLAPNDAGQSLVLTWSDATGLAQFWRAGEFGEYIWDPNEGYVSLRESLGRWDDGALRPRDINNRGHIVAELWLDGMEEIRGVILEPIPEHWGR